ncbi:glycosyltransferase family 4 protein [Mucilaginibacter calamicampi]|uniref:Glycosyltransferase family 4 protein n=1 Tax=Mucilaginibacter calamicampi TaxID=1302352 RepID=A0ABW2YSQ4_9SPHI
MPKYLSPSKFKGFGADRVKFITEAVKLGRQCDTVILSHINMAAVGLVIKLLNPKCRLMLIAHGIEVWRPVSSVKKLFLRRCDKIICVSEFTRTEVIKWHNVSPAKCVVLNNAIDPFMKLPAELDKPAALLERYGLTLNNDILFTLTRLANTEQYKGYDQVIRSLAQLKTKFPEIKYVLAGQYDEEEKQRINNLIAQHNAEGLVILSGFINEEELTDHFLIADLFILPSKKEGFGIVFIEALACGLPVICGNTDGSLDAVKHGQLGTAINPDNADELELAVVKHLENRTSLTERASLQQQCISYFNSDTYIANLEKLLINDR